MKRSLGIDLSEWDLRPLNWSQAQEILSFAFIKISQGTNPDPLFRAQWEAAEGYVLRGLYHMLEPREDVDRSVDKTLELYKAVSPGELPPALDLELGDVRTELPRAKRWLERWESKTGKRPIIYTSLGFLDQEQTKNENRWLGKYPLWLSLWPFDKMSEDPRRARIRQVLRSEILIPYPTASTPWPTPPDFHQWTSRGEPGDIPGYYMGPGHKKAVDFNYYHGTKEDLFTRFGEPKKRPGNGVIMPTLYKYSIKPIKSDGSKVRNDHYAIDSPIPNRIGSLAFGRFAFGDDLWTQPTGAKIEDATDVWLKVKSVDGVALEGWIAAKHKGNKLAEITPLSSGGGDLPGEEIPEIPAASLDIALNIEADVTESGLKVNVTVTSPGFDPGSASVTLPKET